MTKENKPKQKPKKQDFATTDLTQYAPVKTGDCKSCNLDTFLCEHDNCKSCQCKHYCWLD